jgi:hypothetical protein
MSYPTEEYSCGAEEADKCIVTSQKVGSNK